MAGYSTTPLPEKLGIRPGFRVYFLKEPPEVHGKLRAAITQCEVIPDPVAPLDFAMVFATSRAELGTHVRRAAETLAPKGMLWAAWPKKVSGTATDLDEHQVREIGLRAGLVDVKVVAITETWSGLKFVRRVRDRGAPPPSEGGPGGYLPLPKG